MSCLLIRREKWKINALISPLKDTRLISVRCSRYLENVKRISLFFRDQPQTPKDMAVYWAEYVMRHKGAKQLRSAARDLNFFQYYLIDVMTLMFTIIVVILFVVCLVLRVVLRIAHRTFSAPKPKAKIQ